MMQRERRRAPEKVQMTFVATKEMRHAAKMRALQKGLTVREYLTDLVLRDLRRTRSPAGEPRGKPRRPLVT